MIAFNQGYNDFGYKKTIELAMNFIYLKPDIDIWDVSVPIASTFVRSIRHQWNIIKPMHDRETELCANRSEIKSSLTTNQS
jgi:hypothetical protein